MSIPSATFNRVPPDQRPCDLQCETLRSARRIAMLEARIPTGSIPFQCLQGSEPGMTIELYHTHANIGFDACSSHCVAIAYHSFGHLPYRGASGGERVRPHLHVRYARQYPSGGWYVEDNSHPPTGCRSHYFFDRI